MYPALALWVLEMSSCLPVGSSVAQIFSAACKDTSKGWRCLSYIGDSEVEDWIPC